MGRESIASSEQRPVLPGDQWPRWSQRVPDISFSKVEPALGRQCSRRRSQLPRACDHRCHAPGLVETVFRRQGHGLLYSYPEELPSGRACILSSNSLPYFWCTPADSIDPFGFNSHSQVQEPNSSDSFFRLLTAADPLIIALNK